MPFDRREFLRFGLTAAVAAGSAGSLAARAAMAEEAASPTGEEPVPIVDTHQHLWDLTKLRLSWLKADTLLNRSFLPSDYAEATRGLGVVKSVYMEVAVDDTDLVAEAEYVIGLCESKSTPTVAAVIGGRPAEKGFAAYIGRFKESPYIKGVRHILPTPPGAASLWRDKAFVAGVRLLGELGMSFDLCMPPAALPDAAWLVDECPGTRFILDHCGNADPNDFGPGVGDEARRRANQWRTDLAKLAERKAVVCKISGIVARMAPGRWKPDDLAPVVNHCLEVFGSERVIFASDWPVCTRGASLREWVEGLRAIVAARPLAERRKLFHDNAVRWYGLG